MNRIRIMLAVLLLPLYVSVGFAQQDPVTSVLYEVNPFYNPSFMVNDHALNAAVIHRSQWIGLDGAPMTTSGSASYEIEKIKSTFGLLYMYDTLGAMRIHQARFQYAYRVTIKEKHHLIPSIYLGMQHITLNGTLLNPIQPNDPNIISTEQTDAVFDMGIGLAYRFRYLVLGFSASHITTPKAEFKQQNATSTYTLAPHLYFTGRYDVHLGKLMRLMPKTVVRSDIATTQFDAGLWVGFDELTDVFQRVNVGAAYRYDDAVMVSAELIFKWFTLGYAYDITISGLKNYSKGSHEGYVRLHLFPHESEVD